MFLFHGVHPKRISVPALILTLLFAALAGSLLTNQAAANPMTQRTWPYNHPPSPTVEVIGIDADKLAATFSVEKAGPWITEWRNPDFKPEYPYSIISVKVVVDGETWSQNDWAPSPISISLKGLSNGVHTLEVTATTEGSVNAPGAPATLRYTSQGSSGVMEFFIDNPPPMVSILSLTNVPADEGDFQLALRVVGKSLSWMGYTLDGEKNVTVNPDILVHSSLASQDEVWKGNVTLVGLSGGLHSLVVYAEEMTGSVGASSPATFTVEMAGQQISAESSLFPTTLLIEAVVVVAVVACSVLLVYFIKFKKRRAA
jgi:hypothetical protein